MKKSYFLVIIGLLLVFGCSMNEKFNRDFDPAATGLLKSHPGCAVITVEPGGGDDTQAFIDAFNEAKMAGPGTVLGNAPGPYLILQVEDMFR